MPPCHVNSFAASTSSASHILQALFCATTAVQKPANKQPSALPALHSQISCQPVLQVAASEPSPTILRCPSPGSSRPPIIPSPSVPTFQPRTNGTRKAQIYFVLSQKKKKKIYTGRQKEPTKSESSLPGAISRHCGAGRRQCVTAAVFSVPRNLRSLVSAFGCCLLIKSQPPKPSHSPFSYFFLPSPLFSLPYPRVCFLCCLSQFSIPPTAAPPQSGTANFGIPCHLHQVRALSHPPTPTTSATGCSSSDWRYHCDPLPPLLYLVLERTQANTLIPVN